MSAKRVMEMFDIEIPLFAFSHCRDVVAAVTNAGGLGVLGASTHTPDELEQELRWLDEHVDGKPYGVDIVAAENIEGGIDFSGSLASYVPDEQLAFVNQLLVAHGVPALERTDLEQGMRVDEQQGRALLDVSMSHPIRLIASALGVPPTYMVDAGRANGVRVAALVGAKEHALRQVAAGVDLIVAQGSEAGGHTGEVGTMVLVPEVVAAVAAISDIPVLAAGGIVTGSQMAAAVALGASGAWTGSVWLTTEEAETHPITRDKMLAASSRDTVRSKGRTGKYSRQLVSGWTRAWTAVDNPGALPMPLQSVLSEPALARIDSYAAAGNQGAVELASYFVGQGVGLMNRVRPTREVVLDFAQDYVDAVERLNSSIA